MESPAFSKGVSLVLTTVEKREHAMQLAHLLVDEELAACVSILPGLLSVYAWRGKLEEEQEIQLVIKTRSEAVPDLKRRLDELHPYDLPEFLVLDAQSSSAYKDWVWEQVPKQGNI